MSSDNSDIVSLLADIGCGATAARLYETLLSAGPASLSDLVGRSTIKRGAAYLGLRELLEKGLVAVTPSGRTHVYSALDPEASMRVLIETRKRRLSRHESGLKSLFAAVTPLAISASKQNGVHIYQGKAGLQHALKTFMAEKQDIRWLGSLDVLEQLFGNGTLLENTRYTRYRRDITTYAITDKSIFNDARYNDAIELSRHFRIADYDALPDSLLAISGSVALIATPGEFGPRIIFFRDDAAVIALRALYELLWSSLSKHHD